MKLWFKQITPSMQTVWCRPKRCIDVKTTSWLDVYKSFSAKEMTSTGLFCLLGDRVQRSIDRWCTLQGWVKH